jgi:hypothetical protein
LLSQCQEGTCLLLKESLLPLQQQCGRASCTSLSRWLKGRTSAPSLHIKKVALTRNLARGGREGHLMRRQTRESNPLAYVLPRSYAGLLNPSGSVFPDLLVERNSGLYVASEAILVGKDDAECSSVLDGLTGPLGLMRLFATEFENTIRAKNGCV